MKEKYELFIDGKKIAESTPCALECIDRTLFKYAGIIDGCYTFKSAFGIITVPTDDKESISNILDIGKEYKINYTKEENETPPSKI